MINLAKPTHLDHKEQTQANREGWGIYHPDGYVGGRVELQAYRRMSDTDFASDTDALAFVRSKAKQSSKLHIKALSILEQEA